MSEKLTELKNEMIDDIINDNDTGEIISEILNVCLDDFVRDKLEELSIENLYKISREQI